MRRWKLSKLGSNLFKLDTFLAETLDKHLRVNVSTIRSPHYVRIPTSPPRPRSHCHLFFTPLWPLLIFTSVRQFFIFLNGCSFTIDLHYFGKQRWAVAKTGFLELLNSSVRFFYLKAFLELYAADDFFFFCWMCCAYSCKCVLKGLWCKLVRCELWMLESNSCAILLKVSCKTVN